MKILKKFRSVQKFILIMMVLTLMVSACSRDEVTVSEEESTPDETGQGEPISKTEFMLDTFCTVTVFSQEDERYIDEALAICAGYEKLFSRTIDSSEISKINMAKGEAVEVSAETIFVLETAIDYAKKSAGAFDISIGAVSALWAFDSENPNASLPLQVDIDKYLPTVDYKGIELLGGSVRLKNPDTKLDFGGIAKGYIADKMADYLIEKEVSGAIIDLGGNVVTVGSKASGEPWNVGVKNPFPDEGEGFNSVIGAIKIDGRKSIGTSGVYERYLTCEGERYHHILDPQTGFPVVTDLVGITVVTDMSIDGEGVTTTCILLGSEKAKAFLEKDGIQAVLVKNDGTIITTASVEFSVIS